MNQIDLNISIANHDHDNATKAFENTVSARKSNSKAARE